MNHLTYITENEKNGVIYMKSGSNLIISSKENENPSLLLITNKGIGIYGEESTNLNINNNIKFSVKELSTYHNGMIYIGNDIIINGGEIKDLIRLEKETSPSIKAGGSIIIKKGSLDLHSIQAEKSIILGEKGKNNDLEISIKTVNEGIKAKNIEIYSCQIEIFSVKESFISSGDIIISNAMLKIYAGTYNVISSPIKYDGKLEIDEAYIMVCGKNCTGVVEIITNKQSFSHFGKYITNENPVNRKEGIYLVEEANKKDTFSCYITYPNKNIDIELYVDFKKFESYENNKCPIDSTDNVNEISNDTYENENENNNDNSQGWSNSEFRKISYLLIIICLMLIK